MHTKHTIISLGLLFCASRRITYPIMGPLQSVGQSVGQSVTGPRAVPRSRRVASMLFVWVWVWVWVRTGGLQFLALGEIAICDLRFAMLNVRCDMTWHLMRGGPPRPVRLTTDHITTHTTAK